MTTTDVAKALHLEPLAARPRWIDPTWEPLPFESWPEAITRVLRRNGVETWEQLEKLSPAQVMLWRGAGHKTVVQIRELVYQSGRSLRLPAVEAAKVAPNVLLPVQLLPQPEEDRQRYCGVYFIQSTPFIKIGVSYDVRERLRVLRFSNPHETNGIGWIKDIEPEKRERRLHAEFAAHRYRGEWFRENPDLAKFISDHAEPWPTEPLP